MQIVYILIILITLKRVDAQSVKDFDLLINIAKRHFYPGAETYLIDNSKVKPYLHFKELCRVFSANWPVITGDDENEMFTIPARREVNILLVELDYHVNSLGKNKNGDENFYTRNKNIFYIDLRKDAFIYSHCSAEAYLNKIHISYFWFAFFQTIIVFHYPKNCPREFEIWTREPWSEKAGQRIINISDAYFNKKPNMHGAIIKFDTTVEETLNFNENIVNRLEIFQNIWFEKWNMLDYDKVEVNRTTIVINALISLEPVFLGYNGDAYNILSMCFVVRKGAQRPKWESIIWCFHWKVWLSLTLVWFISGLTWFFIIKPISLFKSLCDVCSLIFSQPISWLPNIRNNLSRYIAGLFMLTSIVIITGFQTRLYINMRLPRLYPPIDDIKQIKDLNITILCTYTYTCDFIFNSKGDKLFTELSKQWNTLGVVNNTITNFLPNVTVNDIFTNSQTALLTPCASARSMLKNIPKFAKKLHLVEEKISIYPLYYTQLPFEEHLRQLLFSYLESGIGQWVDHMIEWRNLIKILQKEEKQSHVKVFNLDDVQIAFIMLFIGLFISTLVFIFECLTKYWHLHYYPCKKSKCKREKYILIPFKLNLRRKYFQHKNITPHFVTSRRTCF